MTPRTLNRLKVIGIGVIAILPVVASYLLYWLWTPEQHINYGTLLEPRPLPQIALRTLEGQAFELADLRGHWVLLTTDGGKCGPRCQATLWKTRQVRQAQGKEMNRIERVWLIDDAVDPDAETLKAHPGLRIARGASPAITAALPAQQAPHDHVYLVDPLGNLMLRFPSDADPKRMIRDLTRLLKYSRSG